MSAPEINTAVRYERRDVNARALLAIVAGTLLAGVLGYFLLSRFLNGMETRRERVDLPHPMAAAGAQTAPPPVLQITEEHDLQAHRAREAEFLNGYGWSDRENGRVRIPIERAIELMVEREAKR